MSTSGGEDYDRFADRYDEIFGDRQRDKIIKLAAYIPSPWPTPGLDAGAGTGIAQRVLKYPFVHVDRSPEMLRHASEPRFVADIHQLPFPDQTFGLVLSVSVIDRHFDLVRVIEELYRVLRPGGYLAVTSLKSEDVAGMEWALSTCFSCEPRRVDLGPDVGFVIQRQGQEESSVNFTPTNGERE